MTSQESVSCPSCGARNDAANDVCDLCGTSLYASGFPPRPQGGEGVEREAAEGVFCHQCGWESPPEARFCSKCGAKLQQGVPVSAAAGQPRAEAVTAIAPPPPAEASADASGEGDSSGAMGRQVVMIVGIGVMLVLGLFLISAYSNQMQEEQTAPAAGPPAAMQAASPAEVRERTLAAELPENLQRRVEALQAEAEALEGEAAVEKRRELVNLFIGFGRRGRAALAQEALAQEEQTFAAWRNAGNYFYDWMRTEQGFERRAIASMAVDAYEKALGINPDDLDVRTDLATAYLETNNPMRGVQLVKEVLADDPNHVQARFNYGIMLLRIQRLEEALEQFKHVQRVTEEGSEAYRQATELIGLVEEQMAT